MSRGLLSFVLLFASITLSSPHAANSQEIGFIEEFALADDRNEALDRLVPGTQEYYYYHALHYQNHGDFEKANQLLKPWIKRYGETHQVKIIQNRQALLTFDNDPDATYKFLQQRLRLRFNHEREIPTAERNLPSKLDPKVISIESLTARALRRHEDTSGFNASGLEHLDAGSLGKNDRRSLLSRLRYPDYPKLVSLIVSDLKEKDSGGFGSLTIHSRLTIEQLESCLNSVPKLIDNSHFVNAYLSKLHPSDDVNWRANRTEHREYLKRLHKFCQRLNPSFNSLKACVLYRMLDLERLDGNYDRELFIDYLKLPRERGYVNPQLIKQISSRSHIVNLGADYRKQILLVPIHNDEPLVRDYLHQLLVNASNFDKFRPYIRDQFLKREFATVKILNGKGDKENWASVLSPQQYKQLVERVDLDFALTNKEFFDDGDEVEIELFTKNIEKLIIKVYELNTFNFYRKHQREVDTDINLDGLVPNFERSVQYKDDPVLRKSRRFQFPELAGNGVFVVDFIGAGKSSRALIRRGRLSMVGQTSIAGQLFRVFDHNKEQQTDASIWVAGNRYVADKDGVIAVPFSTQPGDQYAIISAGGFSSLQRFQHQAEQYTLDAAMYVDRESLLRNQGAKLLIRPTLKVSGIPTSVKLLQNIQLSISSTNQSGVTATKRLDDLQLQDDAETVCEFVVPPRLKTISFELSCKVENVSGNREQNLLVSRSFDINKIDASDEIQDVHLMPTDQGYVLEVLGKSGEIRPRQAVRVRLSHRDFKDPVSVDLQSNEQGQVYLGQLDEIVRVEATVAGGSNRVWPLRQEGVVIANKVHAIYGDVIEIAAPADLKTPSREDLSLFEKRRGQFVADWYDNIKVENGRVLLTELAAGDYQLRFKSFGKIVNVSVIDGEGKGGVVLGDHRRSELRITTPLVIRDVEVANEKLTVDLGNSNKMTRVHVVGTRYLPRFDSFSEFTRVADIAPWQQPISVRRSAYMAGRTLSDEYQYILNRRYEKNYPGNMLNRPSILVNPWSIRDTQNNVESLAGGDDFRDAGNDADATPERESKRELQETTNADFANLDFVKSVSIVATNLRPDKDGFVELNRDQLNGLQHIRIIAVAPVDVAQRVVNLKPSTLELRDLRLGKALDPNDHFAQAKQIEIMQQGETLTIEDLVSGRFHYFDDLSDVFRLYMTLNPNTRLGDFEFLLSWSNKSDEEKRTLYSKFTCHELNYYLSKKDKSFFDSVIAPHISHKMETGFVDHFLLSQNVDRYSQDQWKFARLNMFERILLAQRLESQSDDIAHNIEDIFLLNPGKREYFDLLYDTSIRTGELEPANYRMAEDLERDNLPRLQSLSAVIDKSSDIEGSNALALGRSKNVADGKTPVAGAFVAPRRASKPRASATLGAPADSPIAGKAVRGVMMDSDQDQKRALEIAKGALRERRKAAYKKLDSQTERFGAYFDYEANEKLVELRQQTISLYKRLPATKEWIEQQYYHLPLEQQDSNLVRVNRFWRDYAKHDGGPFLSRYFAESHRTLTEMMFALAVLDLPEKAPEHKFEYQDDSMQVTAGSPLIAMHQQFRPVMFQPQNTAILISENFFQKNDRYRHEDGVRFDKFVNDKFYAHTLYGAQVVLTNPTSTPQAVDLLVQIPRGAVATSNSQQTRSQQMQLDAFSTKTMEYFFYFPTAGEFSHYPAHVSRDDQVLAVADNVEFNVTDQPAVVDQTSWAYVSQNGTVDDVLEFLARDNVQQLELSKIAFRMRNKSFFTRVIELLKRRYRYDHTLWSYGLYHKELSVAQEFLRHEDRIATMAGRFLQSPLLTIAPYVRNWYQHREYSPLTNARAHQVGVTRKILNPTFLSQYHLLLDVLSHHQNLSSEDRLVVTYYLLLQDRISEAIQHFGNVDKDDLNEHIQFDYCDAYLNFYLENPEASERIARKWADYPVDHWRNRFRQILTQVDEIRGSQPSVVDKRDDRQKQTELAANTAAFDFEIESRKVKLSTQAISELELNFYEMDIELMFSRNPFQQTNLDGFSVIKPMLTQTIKLENKKKHTKVIDLPEEFRTKNVLVEIRAGDQLKALPCFANSMTVKTIEKYGQLHATTESDQPVSKAYVKVYSRHANGQLKFHKDGYTDLRGRFDYVSQSNNPLDGIEQYSILVLSPEFGAITRQVAPPAE